MDISKTNTQVNILFENEEEIEFLIGMCFVCIDYDLDGYNRENARDIIDILDTED